MILEAGSPQFNQPLEKLIPIRYVRLYIYADDSHQPGENRSSVRKVCLWVKVMCGQGAEKSIVVRMVQNVRERKKRNPKKRIDWG
jgi:hypothetical protein